MTIAFAFFYLKLEINVGCKYSGFAFQVILCNPWENSDPECQSFDVPIRTVHFPHKLSFTRQLFLSDMLRYTDYTVYREVNEINLLRLTL